jgi:hypothetical protein
MIDTSSSININTVIQVIFFPRPCCPPEHLQELLASRATPTTSASTLRPAARAPP